MHWPTTAWPSKACHGWETQETIQPDSKGRILSKTMSDSTRLAGNNLLFHSKSVTVTIPTLAQQDPGIGHMQAPTPNANIENSSPVSLGFAVPIPRPATRRERFCNQEPKPLTPSPHFPCPLPRLPKRRPLNFLLILPPKRRPANTLAT